MTISAQRLSISESGCAPSAGGIARHRMSLVRGALSVMAVAAIILALAVFGIARVEHDSMSPTLDGGDTVLFDRLSHPARGDVVLFVDRDGWSSVDDAILVKRVIGVSGDIVVCCEAGSGKLILNGTPLVESYVSGARPGGLVPFRVTVAEGTVWVMGDNRTESIDSRSAVNGPTRGGVAIGDVRGVIRWHD
ncbi:signal peptidase I [Microbacterium lacus]|uniref:signal peptidase I n=1 Tax=Microbacterium lacus TaxID=415217 RepID=UPI0038511DEF